MPGIPKPDVHLPQEETMPRKYIDCREMPSESNCTVAISADSENELLEAAVQHAVTVHKHKDSPELRQMIKGGMKNGTPPLAAPARAG
jgi:predicted small metal-binding protein